MPINKYICLVILSYIFAVLATADEIYQYIDNNGNTVIGNKAVKNAQKLNLPALTYSTSITNTDNSRKSSSRIEILKGELEREKQALENTKSLLEQNKNLKITDNLTEQKQAKERTKTLEAAFTEHKKNIEILTKQLAGQ